MNDGAMYAYKFGRKNQWRRTMWNRVVERLSVKPKDAVVLYLAGEMDLDRAVAVAKGFRNTNMFAVERNPDVAAQLRKNGAMTVKGDLNDVIVAWNGLPVDVVIADFCCGMNMSPMLLANRLSVYPGFSNTVVMFNLMRGRDKLSDSVLTISGPFFCDLDRMCGKHRGRRIYCYHLSMLQAEILAGKPSWFGMDAKPRDPSWGKVFDWIYPEEVTMPWFDSYMSTSGQVFDSAVYKNVNLFDFDAKFLRGVSLMSVEYPELGIDPIETRSMMADILKTGRKSRADTQNPIARSIIALRATRSRILAQS